MEITGLDEATAANVRAFLSLEGEECTAAPGVVRREFASARQQMLPALQAFGFYAPSIESRLEFGDDCWTARFTIDPGEPVRIRTLDFDITGPALTDAAFLALGRDPGLAVGDALHHGAYEQLKRRLTDLARERGYMDAQMTANRIDVYPEDLAADVVLHFVSGQRYAFGAVHIEQDVLREEFVGAYIPFDQGDPYNNALLTSAYVALTATGYFEIVDIRTDEPDRVARTVTVTIALTPARRRQITYGVGVSTDLGPHVRFGRQVRRFNDRGHQLALSAELSPVISEVTASYRYPFGDPRYRWVNFVGGLKRQTTDTSDSDTFEFGVRRVTDTEGAWSRAQRLSYAVEDFEVGDQQGHSRLLTPGMDWWHLRADNALRPTTGSRLRFELRGAAEAIASDTSFVRAVADAKWITSLSGGARIIARGRFGILFENDFEKLPPSVRFFAGGDNSIRGYGFETLGPLSDTGAVMGGTRLAVGSFEYEHPIRQRWSVATFVDAGNAFNQSGFDVKSSAGIGARWRSPLGPIRIDIGVPIDDPDHDPRLHISVGPDL